MRTTLGVAAAVLLLGGCKGSVGDPGLAGAQGPAGPTGSRGDQGLQGQQGATGPAGAQGPSGAPGAQGPAGPAGADGRAGRDGLDGAQGPTGAAGATALSPFVIDASGNVLGHWAGFISPNVALVVTNDQHAIEYTMDGLLHAPYLAKGFSDSNCTVFSGDYFVSGETNSAMPMAKEIFQTVTGQNASGQPIVYGMARLATGVTAGVVPNAFLNQAGSCTQNTNPGLGITDSEVEPIGVLTGDAPGPLHLEVR